MRTASRPNCGVLTLAKAKTTSTTATKENRSSCEWRSVLLKVNRVRSFWNILSQFCYVTSCTLVTIKLIRHDKLSQLVEEMNMSGTTDLFLVEWVQNLPTAPNHPPTGIVFFWFAVLWLFMNREFLS